MVRIDLAQNEICVVPSRADFSSEETAKVWYSRDESEAIKEALLLTIARLNNGMPFNEIQETARGLEFFTCHGALKRECTKLRLYRSIMEEQERQRRTGVCDTEQIALVASRCAVGCADFALSTAAYDQNSVCASTANADVFDNNDENCEDEEEALIKRSLSIRPVLSLCCWDFGLSCWRNWR